MRRNLTISFDERFIQAMDSARGETPRGVWIERAAESGKSQQRVSADAELARGRGPVIEPKPDRTGAFRKATQ